MPKKQDKALFELHVGFLYTEEHGPDAGRKFEKQFTTIIVERSVKRAIFAAFVWLENRVYNLKDSYKGPFPAFIKVNAWKPGFMETIQMTQPFVSEKNYKVHPDGRMAFGLYEWKYDTGRSFQEEKKVYLP